MLVHETQSGDWDGEPDGGGCTRVERQHRHLQEDEHANKQTDGADGRCCNCGQNTADRAGKIPRDKGGDDRNEFTLLNVDASHVEGLHACGDPNERHQTRHHAEACLGDGDHDDANQSSTGELALRGVEGGFDSYRKEKPQYVWRDDVSCCSADRKRGHRQASVPLQQEQH